MTGDSPFEPPTTAAPGDQPPPSEPPSQPPQFQPPQFQPPQTYAPPNPAPPTAQPHYQPPPLHPPPGFAPPAPPPKKSKAPWIILGVVLGFIVLVVGSCAALIVFAAGSADDGIREVFSELAIDFSDGVPPTGPVSCEVTGIQDDGSGDYEVIAVVSNESGVGSHYLVDYELVGPGGEQLGTDFGIVSNVPAGDLVRDSTVGIIDAEHDWTEVDCQVTNALRVPA